MHAEIAGAGFAGLTAAIALKQRGWSVRVHESSPELRAFGAGIFIWENGLRVLRAVGAYEDAVEGVHDAGIMESRIDGRSLGTQQFGAAIGTRMLCMTRQHLYNALLAAAQRSGVEIRTNSEVSGVTPEGTLATVSGGTFPADLVIGADGVRSRVRDSVPFQVERYTCPDGVIRLLTTRTNAERESTDWNRVVDFWTLEPRPLRILYTPCNYSELYLCMMAPSHNLEASAIPIRHDVWSTAFPYLADVIARVGPQGRHDLYQTSRVDRWSIGCVALIGDAAHAMPPTLGQGAGLAMGNALALAVSMEGPAPVEEKLAAWEAAERPLTDHTQAFATELAQSRGLANGHHWSDDALRAARHIPTGTQVG